MKFKPLREIFSTSFIVPVVLISLYIITAGIKDNEVNVSSQPIAWPQSGYLYSSYDSGEYVTNWKMNINCRIKIKSLISIDGKVYASVFKTSAHAYFSIIFEYAAAKESNDLPKEFRTCVTLKIVEIKSFELLIESDKTQHKCGV